MTLDTLFRQFNRKEKTIMAKFEKILKHPDRDHILDLLANHEHSLRSIEAYTKEKYPDNPTFQLSETTLRKFMKDGAGVIRDKATQIELSNAFNSFITGQEPPEELSRTYPTPSGYVVEDHAVLAESIQLELEHLSAVLGGLFVNALHTTSSVLEQIAAQERDARDFKQMTSATKDISDMYNLYCFQRQQTTTDNTEDSFDSFIASLEAGDTND